MGPGGGTEAGIIAPVQLTSLSLLNWKSFGDDRNKVDFAPLTLLVGPNASGKSNVLDALRTLQGCALDYRLTDVLRGRWEGQREVWPGIRGKDVEACHWGTTDAVIASDWAAGQNRVVQQALQIDCERGAVGRTVSTSGVQSDQDLVTKAQREMIFLDIHPAKMRDYQPEPASALGTSGQNISPVLAGLAEEDRQDIIDWLAELTAPAVVDMAFDRTQLKEVMFFLVEDGGRRVSARSVSDGTLRFLGLLTALLTSKAGSIILLEEPDVGLHPSRIHLLARLLEQVTAEARIQVIATTHSSTLLSHLNPESLGNVVAIGRDAAGDSMCGRLRELEHFSTLRDSRQLDHLVSTGWIERAL